MMNYSSTLNPSFWLHFWFILFRENVLAEKTYWNTYWKKYQREMATTGLQLLGFILGVFAWAGMIATCASPEWRKNSVGGTALDQHKRYFFLLKISLFDMKNKVWWSVGSMRTNAERKYQLRKLQCFLHRASRYDFSLVFNEIRIYF